MNVAVLAAIPAHTGLLAWLEARGCPHPLLDRGLTRIHARPGLIGLWPWPLNPIAAVMTASIIRD